MVRLAPERVLLIGDTQREVQAALLQAVPGAHVTSVSSIFDAIAELGGSNGGHAGVASPANGAGSPANGAATSNGAATAHGYTTIIAAAEPIERRPEAAVRTLRELAGDGRLILFGHPTLELLSRKMLQFGCDDYIVTPATVEEIQQVFGNPPMRLAGSAEPAVAEGAGADPAAPPQNSAAAGPVTVAPLPLADVLLDAMLQHPHSPLGDALAQLNGMLGPSMELAYRTGSQAPPEPREEGETVLSHAVRVANETAGTLYLVTPADADATAARHTLAQLAHMFGKVATLADRHNRLQKLAITDELTGVYNARYFRHFLARILDKAKKLHFPVTLLLFDIDDFKKYNDQFGHGVGDEILKQTAAMMKRATREHDLVARIGGDEFAVVFWDKEGPRQPRDPRPGVVSRPPQTPLQIFDRFKRMIASDEFTALGKSGKGVLGISAGLAVYPYEAADAATLIQEADRALMQGAKKRTGKNTIFIVGSDNLQKPQGEQHP